MKDPASPAGDVPRSASDNLCKKLAEKYPAQFLRWVFGVTPKGLTVEKTELQRDPVRADAALAVSDEDTLYHSELQATARSHLPLPLRMLDYYAGFKRLDPSKRIRQALIVMKDTGEEIPDHFAEDDVTCRYTVIRMWEQDPATLLEHDGLLPLATLCRDDGDGAQLLNRVAEEIAALPDPAQRKEQIDAARLLAGMRYNRDLVYTILRRPDMLEESVVYQDIVQEQWSRATLNLLARRFGPLSPRLLKRVTSLEMPELEQLHGDVLDFKTREDLTRWLRKHKKREA